MARTEAERLERRERLAAQAKARSDNAAARETTAERKRDTRRKVIIGSLLVDAAEKDPAWRGLFETLMRRVNREQDLKAFEGWSLSADDGRGAAPAGASAPSAAAASGARMAQLEAGPFHAPFRWDEDPAA
ncbi:mobilization protein [Caulobacter sp. BP25]|uniref:mobilization protein n=1 Tax=Caulobacter sp. BP25 TaxID=2048900 RepID=UPI000C12B37D|nr:mobilization protein [Caulobacter sp. BP25]PHY22887.1 mobilization protein [Caulobacter sp. BP25]